MSDDRGRETKIDHDLVNLLLLFLPFKDCYFVLKSLQFYTLFCSALSWNDADGNGEDYIPGKHNDIKL